MSLDNWKKKWLETAVQATATPALSQQQIDLDQLFDQMMASVNQQIDELKIKLNQAYQSSPQQQQLAANPNPNQFRNLPWLKHGVRGFLRKAWYGDHPDNPDWHEGLSLDQYIKINEGIDSFITGMLVEAVADPVSAILDEFKGKIKEIVGAYLRKAYYEIFNKSPKQTGPNIDDDDEFPTITPIKPLPTKDQEDDPSWLGKNVPNIKERIEIRNWLNKDAGSPDYLSIKKTKRLKAANFMKLHNLDPTNIKHIKMIWPKHKNLPVESGLPLPKISASKENSLSYIKPSKKEEPKDSDKEVYDHIAGKRSAFHDPTNKAVSGGEPESKKEIKVKKIKKKKPELKETPKETKPEDAEDNLLIDPELMATGHDMFRPK